MPPWGRLRHNDAAKEKSTTATEMDQPGEKTPPRTAEAITDEKSKGNGITNMISRAATLSGSLKFETSPGSGCTMTAEFPLENS